MPEYRRLFAAQTVSRWGDTFSSIALVILVYRVTGSGLRVAGTVAFEIVPVLLFGPIAGAVADRLPKKHVMIAGDLLRAALAVLLALGPHRLPVIYAVAFGMSVGSVFFNPASGALLPTLMDEDQLVPANSALWSAAVVSQIALAPAAGLLVATAGPRPAFLINAVSFVVSAIFLSRIASDHTPAAGGSWTRHIAGGISLLRDEPLVRLLAVVQMFAALSAGATSALLVVLAQRRFMVGPSGFGALLSAIGIGAVIGPLILARVPGDRLRPAFVFGPYLLRGAVDFVLAATRQVVMGGAALVAYGIGTSTGMVTFQSLIQTRLRSEIRGRSFALFDVTWQAFRLISLVLGGIAADALGIAAVYWAGGVLLLIAGSIGMIFGRAR